MAAVDLRVWFYHTIQVSALHVSVLKRKLMIMVMIFARICGQDCGWNPYNPGFRVQSAGFRVQGSGFRVQSIRSVPESFKWTVPAKAPFEC